MRIVTNSVTNTRKIALASCCNDPKRLRCVGNKKEGFRLACQWTNDKLITFGRLWHDDDHDIQESGLTGFQAMQKYSRRVFGCDPKPYRPKKKRAAA